MFYNHNKKSVWNKEFELNTFITSQYEYISGSNSQNTQMNIITDYILEMNAEYLNSFRSIYFAEENGFISENAYNNLTRFLIEKKLIEKEMSELHDSSISFFWYKNEYNEKFKKIPSVINLNNE